MEEKAQEKHVATALYKHPILFSKKQFRIMKRGELLKVKRNGHYILFGRKGYKPNIDKEKVKAEIRRLRGLLRRA